MSTATGTNRSPAPTGRVLQHATLTVTTEELPRAGTTFHAELRTPDGTVLEETPTGWWAASVHGGPEDVLLALRAAGWTLAKAGIEGPRTLHAVHRPQPDSQGPAAQPNTAQDRTAVGPLEKRMVFKPAR